MSTNNRVRTAADLLKESTSDVSQLRQNIARIAKRVGTIDELKSVGRSQSDIITLSLANVTPKGKDPKDINLVFGTPLSVEEEYKFIPLYTTMTNHFLDNKNYIHDNQGELCNFLRLLNRRFLRHPVAFEQVQVIIPSDTEVNEAQASQPIKQIIAPLNSSQDSFQQSGAFVPRFKEYSGTFLLSKILPIGEFSGFSYLLKSGATINLNIQLAGVSQAVMLLTSKLD